MNIARFLYQSTPVCVALHVVGHVVVDHERHVGHVDAAPRHVGGDKNVVRAVTETYGGGGSIV